MNKFYNPGCALLLYKPHYAEKILDFLNRESNNITLHTVCCRYEPKLAENSNIINTCAGCDRRFSTLYEGITTESLWEIIAKSDTFPFPNYNGLKMTVHDACPVRKKGQVHSAIRTLLEKMNIEVVEAPNNRANSVCCGDSFYEKVPIEDVHKMMKKRSDTMPCEDVCVYCVSCIKSMYIGGKKPRYILDLLFNQETEAQVYDTVEWHKMLREFIETAQ